MDFVTGFDSLLRPPALLNAEVRFGMIGRPLKVRIDSVLLASPNTDETAESIDSR